MATELPKSKRGLLLPRTCGVTFAYREKFQKSRFNSISISIFKNDCVSLRSFPVVIPSADTMLSSLRSLSPSPLCLLPVLYLRCLHLHTHMKHTFSLSFLVSSTIRITPLSTHLFFLPLFPLFACSSDRPLLYFLFDHNHVGSRLHFNNNTELLLSTNSYC